MTREIRLTAIAPIQIPAYPIHGYTVRMDFIYCFGVFRVQGIVAGGKLVPKTSATLELKAELCCLYTPRPT